MSGLSSSSSSSRSSKSVSMSPNQRGEACIPAQYPRRRVTRPEKYVNGPVVVTTESRRRGHVTPATAVSPPPDPIKEKMEAQLAAARKHMRRTQDEFRQQGRRRPALPSKTKATPVVVHDGSHGPAPQRPAPKKQSAQELSIPSAPVLRRLPTPDLDDLNDGWDFCPCCATEAPQLQDDLVLVDELEESRICHYRPDSGIDVSLDRGYKSRSPRPH